jgi:AraC-like DNA-binding protein
MDRAIPFEDVFASPVLGNLELAVDSPPALLASGMVQIVRRAAGASLPGPLPAALKRVCNVRDMTQVLNAPERTVRDRALREIGLPPKRALRILRLHRALTIARKRDLSWATVACTAGYADQAHLTRECRALLGDTPSQWLARGSADSFKTAAAARL